jgi:hypothetical protein
LPADGVEKLIRLRSRVRQRLQENAEVVGTDEAFFEDENERNNLLDLYHEKAGILDGDGETEVGPRLLCLSNLEERHRSRPGASEDHPGLPEVVYSTRAHEATNGKPPGVLVYMRTAQGNDALAWMDKEGNSVTESQFEILSHRLGPET